MKVSTIDFVLAVMANVDNKKMSDIEFRQFIRNILFISEKPPLEKLSDGLKKQVEKYYKE